MKFGTMKKVWYKNFWVFIRFSHISGEKNEFMRFERRITMTKTVVAAALGECVHVAGVMNFLRLAESAGWKTVFLGPAVPINEVIKAVKREKADMVGISYRLTPETGERLLGEFAEAASELHEAGVRFAFRRDSARGGTRQVDWIFRADLRWQ
jgi:methylmalonyl-CoA mutase cobalamin-binding subunit